MSSVDDGMMLDDTSAEEVAGLSWAPVLIIGAAITFNAVLALVNAHVTPLNSSAVIATEIGIVAAAHVTALTHYRKEMADWYMLLGLFILFALIRAVVTGAIELRFFRDVLLIPTFVVLGMTMRPAALTPLLVVIHLLTLGFLAIEAANIDVFSRLFEVKSYYMQTRDYKDAEFWSDLDLYVSALRPDDRWYSFVDLHRMSSMFLEPLSLGNYSMIAAFWVFVRFRYLHPATIAFLLSGCAIMVIACDGRLATVGTLIIVAAMAIAPLLPRSSAVLYLPVAVAVVVTIASMYPIDSRADDFSGRIAHTAHLLWHYDVAEYLGVSNDYKAVAVDSGLAYLIMTQSLIGAAALWFYASLWPSEDHPDQIRFTHALCLYFTLSALVSFAFLTIKTAALLWCMQGALQRSRTAE